MTSSPARLLGLFQVSERLLQPIRRAIGHFRPLPTGYYTLSSPKTPDGYGPRLLPAGLTGSSARPGETALRQPAETQVLRKARQIYADIAEEDRALSEGSHGAQGLVRGAGA